VPTITLHDLSTRTEHDHDAQTRLHALLDAAVDAIVTIDQHGIIESVNPATERMFNYTPQEMLGNNVSMLMPRPYADRHDDFLRRYRLTGERRIIGVGREVEAMRRDGSVFPVDLAVTEFDIRGRRLFTGLIRDISDRRAAEREAQVRLDELAHAGRLADLGLTTSTIAHEVNQPLAAIVSFAHACQRMLDADEPDRELLREALTQIATQGERASAIIGRIRAMSLKRDTRAEAVNLNESVHNVLSILGKQLRYEQVDLTAHLADDLPLVNADRVHVEQVVMNLVINALDAMGDTDPGNRRLEVETRLDENNAELSVRDSGPGLHADQLERVFDSFYTTKSNGMGVGLSICRGLAEAHGGRLWAESGSGGGAVFHFRLPVPA
jgi:two-component system sensor kinase FixL